jgi:hypothetical protein
VTDQVQKGFAAAGGALEAGKKLAGVPDKDGLLQLAKDGGLLNAGSDFARSKLSKQLAFFKDSRDLDQVKGLLGDSSLMKGALPAL